MASDVIHVKPVSLTCPRCKAKRAEDCETTAGGYSVIHVARINAATRRDVANNRKRRETS